MNLDQLLSQRYTAEQEAAIQEAVNEAKPDGFMEYSWSDRITQRGPQIFAIFDGLARALLPFSSAGEEDETRCEYVPVVVDGRMLERCPDEGNSGILYLMRRTHHKGAPTNSSAWSSFYSAAGGWLWERELGLTNDGIATVLSGEDDIHPSEWA